MASARAVAGAVAVVVGVAAVGVGLTRGGAGAESTARGQAAIDVAVASIDSDVRAASERARGKAASYASLTAVRNAIRTDKRTVVDQVENERGRELRFDLVPGETVELGVTHRAASGPPTVEPWVLQPPSATWSGHAGQPGSFLDLRGGRVTATAVVAFAPAPAIAPDVVDPALGGYVAFSLPVELATASQRLAAAGLAAELRVGADALVLGGTVAPGGFSTEVTLPSHPEARLRLAMAPAAVPGGPPLPWLAGGGALALAGALLIVLRRRADGAAAASGGARSGLTQLTDAGSSSSGNGARSISELAPHGLGPGAVLGRWEITRRLGSGGMADVYLARARGDAGFEKLVALKVMHAHLARNPRAVELFLDEARLAARVVHPNVVQILDLGKIGSDYVICMEFVDGVDLEQLLLAARAAGRTVPLPVALGILRRICDGLGAAHAAVAADGTPLHIVHRDVKTANVLVSRQGAVKVVDFGIAKAAQQVHSTVLGETKGTPSMMAPEQRIGEVVDRRADVYAVAAVGYQLVTGSPINLDVAALAHLGAEGWPHLPPPSQVRPGVPPELDAVLLGAMAFDREHRPPDCATFEAACEQIAQAHHLVAADKDIARWVEGELALRPSAPPPT